MGLLWQIVQRGLSLHMQEAMTSDLRDETKNMNEKEILLYWMNKHLHEGGYKKTVTNFTTDIQVFNLSPPPPQKKNLASLTLIFWK